MCSSWARQVNELVNIVHEARLPFVSVMQSPDRSLGLTSSYLPGGPVTSTLNEAAIQTFWPSFRANFNGNGALSERPLPQSTHQSFVLSLGRLETEPAQPITAYSTGIEVTPLVFVNGLPFPLLCRLVTDVRGQVSASPYS